MSVFCDKGPGPEADVAELLADKGETCVVDRAKSVVEYARRESCGKSLFCREGTIQLSMILRDATEGLGEGDDLELVAEIATQVRDNGGCELSISTAKAVLALLHTYPEEFEQHIKRKRCAALVCREYYTVHIKPETCTGCGACLPKCPERAIGGGEKLIHVIDQEKCTRCGVCIEICRPLFDAVVKAGPVKPKTPDAPVPVGSWEGSGTRRRRRRRGGA